MTLFDTELTKPTLIFEKRDELAKPPLHLLSNTSRTCDEGWHAGEIAAWHRMAWHGMAWHGGTHGI